MIINFFSEHSVDSYHCVGVCGGVGGVVVKKLSPLHVGKTC